MRHTRVSTFILVVVACLCGSIQAELQGGYSHGILNREAVLRSAGQITREAYPNADIVLVDDFTQCSYQADGIGDSWSDSYRKVLSEKGRQEEQNIAFQFVLPYERVKVELLELIKPDGSVVAIDVEKQGKVMIDRDQMSSNIYNPNSKILQVGVPGVEIGDVVHFVTHREILKRYMPGTWDDYQVFESTAPIKHAIYEVNAPKEKPLAKIALKDSIGGTVTRKELESEGRITYRWEVSDVPRMYAEPQMPAAHTVVQRLLVSTVPNWEAISCWYWHLCKPHLDAAAPEMQHTVETLTADLTDRQAKIRAIFDWVSRQVRYTGITIEAESPGWEPHDVKLTFENRHGVCRDKAALLAAMLRLAGFDAYPVLMDTGPKKDMEVPVVSFSHAIVGVRNDDGSYQLMDCTDENTKDLLPSYLCDRSYLIAHPDGKTLQTSPIVPAQENLVFIETSGEMDAQGGVTAQTKVRFDGINDNLYRSYFARMKPEGRRRHFEQLLKASVAGATLTGFDFSPANIQDTSEGLSVRMSFTARDMFIGDGVTAVVQLPYLGMKVGVAGLVIGRTGLEKRRFPFQTQVACGIRETLNLHIDPVAGSFLCVPQFAEIDDQAVSWKRGLEHKAGSLQGESEFLIKRIELDPEQYLQLKEDLKQIEYNNRRMPILGRQPDPNVRSGDIAVLENEIQFNLVNAHCWTERHRIRKEILTYKGKSDHSELRLDFNPVWEDVNLVQVTVLNAGKVKHVSKQEINLMDAEWVASAPRYPAGKTLVVALPAVEIGSVIEYEYERLKKDRPFFAATEAFRGFDPIREKKVRVTAPESLAMRSAKDDNGLAIPEKGPEGEPTISETVENLNGKKSWCWTARSQAAIKLEDSLPPIECYSPTLRITTGDWRTYAQELLPVLRAAASGQADAAQRARQIAQHAADVDEKITIIRDFVARNVRAAGPSYGELPLSAVTPADRTLIDGYGNTTDRAILIHAMLEAIGLHPEFVLVNYGLPAGPLIRFEAEYPTLDGYSDVLVRVDSSQGPVYLNDTNQYAMLGATYAGGHLAVALARGEMETISVMGERKDLRRYEYKIALTEEGDARIAVTRENYGRFFAARNKLFAEMPPEERRRFHQELVSEISQGATADSNLVTDFHSYPGSERFSVLVKRYAVRDGEFLHFELPGPLNQLLGLRSDMRENPFYLDRDVNLRVSTVVELPEGFSGVVFTPGEQQWHLTDDRGTVQVSTSRQDHVGDSPITLGFVHEIALSPFLVEAEGYRNLVEIEKTLTHRKARTVLVVRKKQSEAR
jgi:hypothetical protein